MDIIILLGFIVLIPFVLMIIGIVKLFSIDVLKRKKGVRFLLGGILLFFTMILIGYSICSNINIGGGGH